jgi:hypothetical protein
LHCWPALPSGLPIGGFGSSWTRVQRNSFQTGKQFEFESDFEWLA